MQDDDASTPAGDQDLGEPYRIAQVRFPNSHKWALCGHLFSTRFLFPAPEKDDSLHQLRRPAVQSILDEACDREKLAPGTLGAVSEYL